MHKLTDKQLIAICLILAAIALTISGNSSSEVW